MPNRNAVSIAELMETVNMEVIRLDFKNRQPSVGTTKNFEVSPIIAEKTKSTPTPQKLDCNTCKCRFPVHNIDQPDLHRMMPPDLRTPPR